MGNEGKKNQDYKYFAARLVENEYTLTEQDYLSTNMIFSSEWINPNLDKVGNIYFKLNYLSNILSNELAKKGHRITASNIKDRVRIKKITVYHSRERDEESNRDADYFYIIDSIKFRAFVYKRFVDLRGASISPTHGSQDTKTVYKTKEVPIDDYFVSAANFCNAQMDEYELQTEQELLQEFKDSQLKLRIYLKDNSKIDYIPEKCEIDIDMKKLNIFEFKIISPHKPLIDSEITIKLEGENETLYSSTGEIISQKTISHKKYYAHNILFKFNNAESIQNVKALFVFVKNLISKN